MLNANPCVSFYFIPEVFSPIPGQLFGISSDDKHMRLEALWMVLVSLYEMYYDDGKYDSYEELYAIGYSNHTYYPDLIDKMARLREFIIDNQDELESSFGVLIDTMQTSAVSLDDLHVSEHYLTVRHNY